MSQQLSTILKFPVTHTYPLQRFLRLADTGVNKNFLSIFLETGLDLTFTDIIGVGRLVIQMDSNICSLVGVLLGVLSMESLLTNRFFRFFLTGGVSLVFLRMLL